MSDQNQSKFVRLQKYIADSGVTSRRKAELLITEGRVQVNGDVVTELGSKVDPGSDVVFLDGNPISPMGNQKTYLIFNKPRCVMSTVSDPEGRETVLDFTKSIKERIYPVGRLDYLSEGLLLLTNDGELANMIIHPRYNVIKTYEVKVFGSVTEELLMSLKRGVKTEEGFLKPLSVRIIEQLPGKTWLEFKLGEGKNREIRRLCEAVGMTVDKLRRVAIGGLHIQGIAPGRYIEVTRKELLKSIGIKDNGELVKNIPEFVSHKKTVNLRRKGAQPGTPANFEGFRKFRKESYFQTIKEIKEKRELEQTEALMVPQEGAIASKDTVKPNYRN